MSSSIDVQPTSISPPCSPPNPRLAEKGLTGSVVSRASLTALERDRMYALLETYFERNDRAQFEADLEEKEAVILLRDESNREIQGFSTFMRIEMMIGGQDTVAFFSGDTIVAHEYWGETVLSKLWSGTVFAEAARIQVKRPEARAYWFLICSGYRTFRFLPVFFREFYPHPERPTPPGIKHMLDALGTAKFGDQYDPDSGIVRLRAATPLRQGVADVTEQRLRDPLVAFFTRVNPGHAAGDELACTTEIAYSNLTRAGERMVGIPSRLTRST